MSVLWQLATELWVPANWVISLPRDPCLLYFLNKWANWRQFILLETVTRCFISPSAVVSDGLSVLSLVDQYNIFYLTLGHILLTPFQGNSNYKLYSPVQTLDFSLIL